MCVSLEERVSHSRKINISSFNIKSKIRFRVLNRTNHTGYNSPYGDLVVISKVDVRVIWIL